MTGCGDAGELDLSGTQAEGGTGETTADQTHPGDGDGDPGDGDGDGDPGDGDGDPGDGDGDGDPGDGDGDPGDGDGDVGCDADAFLGQDAGPTPWGEGDFCNDIYLCTDEQGQQDIADLLGTMNCVPGNLCAEGEIYCTFGYHMTVDAELVEDVCSALSIDSVNVVYCKVYP